MVEINPGSDEFALNYSDALTVIELCREHDVPILGGDVVSRNGDMLGYAHQLWGKQYHSLNWYCSREPDEAEPAYAKRSCDIAMQRVDSANTVATKLGQEFMVVLVT
jgi:hypothetical protein